MISKRFADSKTVTGAKIVSFLRQEVQGRESRREPGKVIGYPTVRNYGAACIDLYKQQVARGMNSNPNPNDHPALAALFNVIRGTTNEVRRSNYVDRGAGTLQDGYTTFEELAMINNKYLSWNDMHGIRGKPCSCSRTLA